MATGDNGAGSKLIPQPKSEKRSKVAAAAKPTGLGAGTKTPAQLEREEPRERQNMNESERAIVDKLRKGRTAAAIGEAAKEKANPKARAATVKPPGRK